MINLRDYQEKCLEDIKEIFKTKGIAILAAAPSSGKTIMAIQFIIDNPNSTFLILSHGQTLLKDQWQIQLDALLTKEQQLRVTLGLPQSIHKKPIIVDYIIVDEAHQFYNAKMVQSIMQFSKNAKILALTGTPSNFIAMGLSAQMVIIAGEELVKKEYASDVGVQLVSTKLKLSDLDYNTEGDVKSSSVHKLESTVNEQYVQFMRELTLNLSLKVGVKKIMGPYTKKFIPDAKILKKLGKTMVACKSIAQAEVVAASFIKEGINTVLSHHDLDKNSENIVGPQGFVNNPDIKVLVVVNRGVLGFNIPELQNVVDLTGSRNINTIYQLYARVMRIHKDTPNKFFYKISPVAEDELTRYFMTAALALLWEEFIGSYNGKDPKVIAKKRQKSTSTESLGSKKGTKKPKTFATEFESPFLFDGSPIFQEINALVEYKVNNPNDYYNTYVTTSLKRVVSDFKGGRKPDGFWDKETLAKDALKYETRTEWSVKSVSAYHAALRRFTIDEFCNHMPKVNSWDKEALAKDALKYETRVEWQVKSASAYGTASRRFALDEFCRHMPKVNSWDKETLAKDALKYETRKEWQVKSAGAYSAASSRFTIDEFCNHMPKGTSKKPVECSNGLRFESASAAGKHYKLRRGQVSENIAREHKPRSGLTFKYVDSAKEAKIT